MDEGMPVRWENKPYLAKSYPGVPSYRYLRDARGTTFLVPESELENVDDLVAEVDWLNATKGSK